MQTEVEYTIILADYIAISQQKSTRSLHYKKTHIYIEKYNKQRISQEYGVMQEIDIFYGIK